METNTRAYFQTPLFCTAAISRAVIPEIERRDQDAEEKSKAMAAFGRQRVGSSPNIVMRSRSITGCGSRITITTGLIAESQIAPRTRSTWLSQLY